MNLQQMRYFLDVAQTEHMTLSAERLHIAQPALSRTIRTLEHELGCTLFAHEGRGIRLTPAGHLAQRRIGQAVAQLDALATDLADAERPEPRAVEVKVKAASYLAVQAISEWMGAHPGRRVRLAQSENPGAPADVVVECPPIGAEPETGLECRRFTEQILVAVPEKARPEGAVPENARPESAAPQPERMTLSQLAGAPFVALAGSRGFRRVCDQLCARQGFQPTVALESDNPDVVRKAISLGLGVGFWPEWSWGAAGSGVALRPLAEPGFERTLVLTRRTAAGSDFFAHLCAFFAAQAAAAGTHGAGSPLPPARA